MRIEDSNRRSGPWRVENIHFQAVRESVKRCLSRVFVRSPTNKESVTASRRLLRSSIYLKLVHHPYALYLPPQMCVVVLLLGFVPTIAKEGDMLRAIRIKPTLVRAPLLLRRAFIRPLCCALALASWFDVRGVF